MTHNSPVNFKLIRFLLWIERSHQSNKELLEFIRPSPNSIFDIHNPYGIKLLTRLRLSLSHLNEYKFKHGFNDAINTICICGGDIESINHFCLHFPEYCEARKTLLDNIQSTDKMLLSQNKSSLTHLLLYGPPKGNSNVNGFILNSAVEFILSSERFNRPLFNRAWNVFFSFSNSFFICLFVFFCLFIPLCYFSFVLISQVFVIPVEYLPNSSCHFRHHKSVFLQILHHLSVTWEITLLYCFRSKFMYFAQKVPINAKKLRCAQVKIYQILVAFENDFNSNFIYLEQKSISKSKF